MKEGDIKKYFDFLGHKNQTELRFIKPAWKDGDKKPIQEWCNNFEQIMHLIRKYDGEYNLYAGINERKPLGDKDDDVEFITNVGHDIDSHNNPDKLIVAKEIAEQIKEDSIKAGYCEPLIMCSGRGYWIIHHTAPIENNEENREKIKQFGLTTKKIYERGGVDIDVTVYNPSRIARIGGTLNISDKENIVESYLVNNPNNNEDEKFREYILNLKIENKYSNPIIEQDINVKSDCYFMDYCLTHEIPKGERHKVISRNMSIYISKKADRKLLEEQYYKIQHGSNNELTNWLKSIDSNHNKDFPFSCGELINFQKKYGIPLKCKSCPKYKTYKQELKAQEKLKKAVDLENIKISENAERIIRSFYSKEDLANQLLDEQPIYFDENKNWWFWDDDEFRWKIIDETGILNFVSKLSTADTINSKEKSEIKEAIRQISRKRKPKEVPKTWIQFKDIIVDVITGDEFDATSEYFITNPIPHTLDLERSSETPTMDKIFEEWVGKNHVKKLYQILAYSLLPDYPIHRLFCFIGGGMNGKSCFLNLLRKFIGNNNCCATELDILLSSKFEVTRLHKKLVCQMGETNFNEMSKTSLLKKLTGGDLIGFEYKNKNPFEELNYAKIIIATNNLPTTTDKTIGFYRRWLIIDFPNQFDEKKDILDDIPKEEYEKLSLKSINILRDLLEKRSFDNEGNINDKMRRYEDKSNPLEKFFKENIIEDYDGFIWKFEFSDKLKDWCKENKFRELSDTAIGIKMKEMGIETQKKINENGGRWNAWVGLKWK